MDARFDSYGSTYGDVVQESISFSGLKHDFFLEAKADVLQRTVAARGLRSHGEPIDALDIGCGIGALHPYLTGLFDGLSGCDISAESVDRARRDNPTVDYRAYAPGRLPYDDASFDLAFASCVVHHVPPAEWPDFFAEMKRVLKPGGIACIIEHNPLNPMTRLAVYRCPFDDDAVLLGSGKTSALFRDAGFDAVEREYFLLLPTRAAPGARVERMLSGMPFGAQYACSARA